MKLTFSINKYVFTPKNTYQNYQRNNLLILINFLYCVIRILKIYTK